MAIKCNNGPYVLVYKVDFNNNDYRLQVAMPSKSSHTASSQLAN